MPVTKTGSAMQPDKAADLLETMLLSPEAADPDSDSVAVSWDFPARLAELDHPTGERTMTKRVAEITLRVRVDVPDDYTDEEVVAIRSRIAHYDIRGGLHEVVSSAALVADTERSVRQMSQEVGIDIRQTLAIRD